MQFLEYFSVNISKALEFTHEFHGCQSRGLISHIFDSDFTRDMKVHKLITSRIEKIMAIDSRSVESSSYIILRCPRGLLEVLSCACLLWV